MNVNVGNIDRALRIILGLALIGARVLNIPDIWSNPVLGYGSLLVGLVLVVTGIFRFCPLYRLLGISTCKV
ncbi:Protein of unknown function [Sulfitobacter marinus]|uniref:Inner membrane protein YgaP-like transmembrane domain-containing protein n=1 Tax=Sulfitobacter marinus TaxID=394264 RepID=A0A1I6QRY8_9RHOB|nr:DUF2892 domain-containing protein [Sulfitobacter marinus]SFS55170.1 Protein of unknown function [Sulfitobacter marinus]